LFEHYTIRYRILFSQGKKQSHLVVYRTIKRAVESELTIPRQSRFLVPIELGKVEKHVGIIRLRVYDTLRSFKTNRCMTKH